MTVELRGDPSEGGILMDFKHLKRILTPLVEQWDHAVLVAEDDPTLKEAAEALDSKLYVLPFDSTAENLCAYVADYLLDHGREVLLEHQIDRVTVRLEETETCYAEVEKEITVRNAPHSGGRPSERHVDTAA
jgi:6-pyruvoyltetrahydropterin/6-carboxytetrahydropterin synthase